MPKVVINRCYGGFGLSRKARDMYQERTGREYDYWEDSRHDPDLIAIVEQLGTKDAGDQYSLLSIQEVDKLYVVHEYDGMETIITPDDMHWIDATISPVTMKKS